MKTKIQRMQSFPELVSRSKIKIINVIRSTKGIRKRQFPNLFIKTVNNEEGD